MSPKQSDDPAAVPQRLRAQALTCTAQDIGVGPSDAGPRIFGILMETAYPEAVATLVVFTDGTTSMYFSTGGGVIGAGAHDSVRETHARLFAQAEALIDEFAPARDTPLPGPGRVRFYLRTFQGTLSAEAAEDDLGYGRHALSELFYAGHAVITAVREASEADPAGSEEQ
jgi:hypothetical protein